MANHISALKRIRQTQKKNLRNRNLRSKLRTELKKFWQLIEKKQANEGQTQLPLVYKSIDKARTKGVINKNSASRKKSQASKWIKTLLQSMDSTQTTTEKI